MRNRNIIALSICFCTCLTIGCRKFIEISAPVTSTNSENVYEENGTAIAVLTNLYADMSMDKVPVEGGLSSIYFYLGLSADELKPGKDSPSNNIKYYRNDLSEINSDVNDKFWNETYNKIYITNAALEGLNLSSTVSPAVKKQLLGEAYFMRAFYFFYLVNLYGDVPLAISTDQKVNATLFRSPKSVVYNQVISDLKQSIGLLSSEYLAGDLTTITEERIRPTRFVAMALLARVSLYSGSLEDAISFSTELIINNRFSVAEVGINDIFKKNSKETIWALPPVGASTANKNTKEALHFLLPDVQIGALYCSLNQNLMYRFEQGDARKEIWIDSIENANEKLYYPRKYNADRKSETSEYSIVFRLAEQYLIRAEARTLTGNYSGAADDLNVIRQRARLAPTTINTNPLPNLPSDLDRETLLENILQERDSELFTEWGHRWFDLKRLGKIDEVMALAAIDKNSNWLPFRSLLPIPLREIRYNPNLRGKQNLGY